jgi:trimeric autotransporter adhesin
MDFRPATSGVLVGVGQQASGAGAVYTINTVTGAATQINSISALNGAAYGVDFNPVPPARAGNAPRQTRAGS